MRRSALARAAAAASRLLAGSAAYAAPQAAVLRAVPPRCRCTGYSRLSTTAAAAPAAPLKSVLRQLYLRVHPDLFTDAPQEQARSQ